MYLRFGAPIDTRRPPRTPADRWESQVRENARNALDAILTDLRDLRAADPFRSLNPLAWHRALRFDPESPRT